MAVAVTVHWADVRPEQYDALQERIRWEEKAPDGAVMHAAWFASDGIHVVDVWEDKEKFERFIREDIMPAAGELGMQGEPEVQIFPLHRRFVAPGVTGAA
ncbi:hypothetical protein [Streptomyces sp. ISL-11]|uniref:hypothetical protein n=1 Tax=Streptomyces sp. ISL-11 TaxID=2819174 RepID=UPI001BEB8C5A|nr:hypothetical protein [Streptomyces sp. ISL-11]MBT2384660.1 hypothetical protein [Streptomyces sp. ISL-11]